MFCRGLNFKSLRRKNLHKTKKGYITLNYQNKKSYMAYYPLKINDWIMCYSIDADVAQESYTVIISLGIYSLHYLF